MPGLSSLWNADPISDSHLVRKCRLPAFLNARAAAQAGGDPLRMLYAFDPQRIAILLLGGDKTGDNRWYETNVPIADRLFELHLRNIKEEGSG